MSEPMQQIYQLLMKDRRYRPEAYQLVRESLRYAQDVMRLGRPFPSAEAAGGGQEVLRGRPQVEHHLTGQQLCEAVRQYALEQYGHMARTVLNQLGIHATSDIGEIVYNLIRVDLMKTSPGDRREDFDNVFDFDTGLRYEFRLPCPKKCP